MPRISSTSSTSQPTLSQNSNDGYESDTDTKHSTYFRPKTQSDIVNSNIDMIAKNYNIEDEHKFTLFPRCEFYHRYRNTSIFPNDITRANVYTRSEQARYAQKNKAKDGKGVKFIPTPLTNKIEAGKNTLSLSAHTGGFTNPYFLSHYARNIEMNKYDFDLTT